MNELKCAGITDSCLFTMILYDVIYRYIKCLYCIPDTSAPLSSLDQDSAAPTSSHGSPSRRSQQSTTVTPDPSTAPPTSDDGTKPAWDDNAETSPC